MANTFEQLKVYQKSMDIIPKIHTVIKILEANRDFDLKSQINRSVVSVSSNISEGAASGSYKVYRRHLNIASDSAAELYTQLKITFLYGYTRKDDITPLLNELESIQQMLHGLIRYTEQKMKTE